jgi:hypothetical protein
VALACLVAIFVIYWPTHRLLTALLREI